MQILWLFLCATVSCLDSSSPATPYSVPLTFRTREAKRMAQHPSAQMREIWWRKPLRGCCWCLVRGGLGKGNSDGWDLLANYMNKQPHSSIMRAATIWLLDVNLKKDVSRKSYYGKWTHGSALVWGGGTEPEYQLRFIIKLQKLN